MPAPEWTPEMVTARDVVGQRAASAEIFCRACNSARLFDMWRIGSRLADTPLQQLRFRCRCGLYASEMQLCWKQVGQVHKLLTIPLRPAAWDDGCEEAQRIASSRHLGRHR